MSETGIKYTLTTIEKAFLIRKRMMRKMGDMGAATGLGSKYTLYEGGELIAPRADIIVENMYDIIFADIKPSLREKMSLLLRRKVMTRYIKKWLYWEFAKGHEIKCHRKEMYIIINASEGLINEEDFKKTDEV